MYQNEPFSLSMYSETFSDVLSSHLPTIASSIWKKRIKRLKKDYFITLWQAKAAEEAVTIRIRGNFIVIFRSWLTVRFVITFCNWKKEKNDAFYVAWRLFISRSQLSTSNNVISQAQTRPDQSAKILHSGLVITIPIFNLSTHTFYANKSVFFLELDLNLLFKLTSANVSGKFTCVIYWYGKVPLLQHLS